MKKYDPMHAPDADQWFALDEEKRFDHVAAYHRRMRVQNPRPHIHAVIHVIVENQLAMPIPPVCATLKRLMAEGLDRHEAIHAIGTILADQVWKILKEDRDDYDPNEQYLRRLQILSANSWRKSTG